MKKMLVATSLLLATSAFAADLTIYGAEFGIGKFHRKDNKVHKYESNNAWAPFILPEGVSTKEIYVKQLSADKYTIFFTNLEEFLKKMVEISKSTGKKIGVINLNAHGLPGGMWFPKDAKTRDSFECGSWRDAASNSDDANYKQYYSAVSKEEIMQMHQMAQADRIPSYNCLTGADEWKEIVAKVPAIKDAFSSDAQVHMHSCLVGSGPLGDEYTQTLANLLFSRKAKQMVQTSIKFGLGDWSMPEGMGFWDYESDEQLDRDNSRYPTHRRDSEMAQRGDIRVAVVSSGKVNSGLMKNQDFLLMEKDERGVSRRAPELRMKSASIPATVRIPGTNVRIKVK